MTTIADHGATVLPFADALLRSPKRGLAGRSQVEPLAPDGELPDNVILLARFSRRARRAHGHHWLGGPPEDDAA